MQGRAKAVVDADGQGKVFHLDGQDWVTAIHVKDPDRQGQMKVVHADWQGQVNVVHANRLG